MTLLKTLAQFMYILDAQQQEQRKKKQQQQENNRVWNMNEAKRI